MEDKLKNYIDVADVWKHLNVNPDTIALSDEGDVKYNCKQADKISAKIYAFMERYHIGR